MTAIIIQIEKFPLGNPSTHAIFLLINDEYIAICQNYLCALLLAYSHL